MNARVFTPPKRPVDELRSIAAPTELVEWVRKLPADTAKRQAWVDAPRADWIPYLAVLRGIGHDAILRAACACALDAAELRLADGSVESSRVVAALRDGTERDATRCCHRSRVRRPSPRDDRVE